MEPTTAYIRRGPALEWIERLGLKESDFDALVEAQQIRRHKFTPNGRYYYVTADIREHIVAPLTKAHPPQRTP